MEFIHEPVMLRECLDALCIRPDGIYVDGTMGGAGHSSEIAKVLGPAGKLIGIDQDEDAIKAAGGRLREYGDRVIIVRDNFRNIRRVMNDLNMEAADGILLDLGVSSYQIDNPERGFSYMQDAPLDMRMDRRGSVTAADIVNDTPEAALARILYHRPSARLARFCAALGTSPCTEHSCSRPRARSGRDEACRGNHAALRPKCLDWLLAK